MRKVSLAGKVFIGFAVGIVLGLIFQEKILAIKLVGDIFLSLIKMLVVPLVFFSIASSVSGIESITKLKKMGGKVLLYYVGTTLICAAIGIAAANIFSPGVGFTLESLAGAGTVSHSATTPGFASTILSMIPTNPFKAFSEGKLIQIIIFALFLGTAITGLGASVSTVKKFIDEGNKLMIRITGMVMELSPYGVAALIACSVGKYGLEVFGPLGKLVGALYLAALVVMVCLYIPMLRLIGKVSIKDFFRHMGKVMVMTISTTSSAGTMPLTLKTMTDDFKVRAELAEFTIPLGTVINMNGAVLYYSMAVAFVAQIYNIDLSLAQQIYLVLFGSVIAMGSPGIPGGGIVMTMVLLSFMNLPLEIMGLIAGVYRLFDMCNTTLNVVGDAVSTLCIASTDHMIGDEIIVPAQDQPQSQA
ncbi:MAG: dicarboxylate/amino acid:cation symporter [Desulfovibrio sp.]|uniref:dicarboxylate/amino acid:cation symporter n=1 Tax=Desulfovibrio sp. 7SRBS1 TaxID=3378064 RepID=UPI003B3F900A